MNKEEIITALERLEEKLHDSTGYKANQILFEMNIPITRASEVKLRTALRKLISQDLYPEFGSAGADDIVYEPDGKNSGFYRLSKYREN